jgi:hypothetical protein
MLYTKKWAQGTSRGGKFRSLLENLPDNPSSWAKNVPSKKIKIDKSNPNPILGTAD